MRRVLAGYDTARPMGRERFLLAGNKGRARAARRPLRGTGPL